VSLRGRVRGPTSSLSHSARACTKTDGSLAIWGGYRRRVTAATAVPRARGTSQDGGGGGEHGMAVLRDAAVRRLECTRSRWNPWVRSAMRRVRTLA
jgi:hypothetical protein